MKRKTYQVWLHWYQGDSYPLSGIHTSEREAEKVARKWREVALITRVEVRRAA